MSVSFQWLYNIKTFSAHLRVSSSVCLRSYLTTSLTVYKPVYLPVCLFWTVSQSQDIFPHLFVSSSVWLCLCICLNLLLTDCKHACLLVSLPIPLSVSLSVCISFWTHSWLIVYKPVCLSFTFEGLHYLKMLFCPFLCQLICLCIFLNLLPTDCIQACLSLCNIWAHLTEIWNRIRIRHKTKLGLF